jgi:hypothetical protein
MSVSRESASTINLGRVLDLLADIARTANIHLPLESLPEDMTEGEPGEDAYRLGCIYATARVALSEFGVHVPEAVPAKASRVKPPRDAHGWCEHCRIVWSWSGYPRATDALCPSKGCGRPLARRPRPSALGKHQRIECAPLTRGSLDGAP